MTIASQAGVPRTVPEFQRLLDFRARIETLTETDQVARATAEAALRMVNADTASVWLFKYQTRTVQRCAGLPGHDFDSEEPLAAVREAALETLSKKRAFHLDELQAGGVHGFIESLASVPIMEQEMPLGALVVTSASPGRFDRRATELLGDLAGQAGSSIARTRRFSAMRELSAAAARWLELHRRLDAILKAIGELGFEFATISMVDKYRGIIETVRGLNVPPAWVKLASHPLEDPDIQAWVVRNQVSTGVIAGWDDRLDRNVYDRFGHADLARVFLPIFEEGEVVGTIEAGCHSKRKQEVFTEAAVRQLESLARRSGFTVARARPYEALALIANHALDETGADSASIHVYESRRTLLVAGAGKATAEFLANFPPRPDGLGWHAMDSGEIQVLEHDLKDKHPLLYEHGVRAMAAIPLSLGIDIQGVLYVHFWSEHSFSRVRLEIARLFAQQAQIAIQNTLLVRNIIEAAERAWTFSRLRDVIERLTSGSSLKDVLEGVAQNVLVMLGADCVTLYQYFCERDGFQTPPVMAGSFRDRQSMNTKVEPDDIVRRMVREGHDRFVSDAPADPFLSGARRDHLVKSRFVDREGIRSSAVLILRTVGEIVGVMFVNYRTWTEFGAEDEQAMRALASSAAIAIKTARLYSRVENEAKRRGKQLDAMRAVDQAIVTGGPDLDQVLNLVLESALGIVDAPVGVIMWWHPERRELVSRVLRGFPDGQQEIVLSLGHGIVGTAAQNMESILVPDAMNEPRYLAIVPSSRCEIAVPLKDQDRLLGVLNVECRDCGKFTKDDQNVLETLAMQAVIAVHSVEMYKHLEAQIRPFRSLSVIATRMSAPEHDLETKLRLLLTGITVKQGLAFSRAMLFLLDESGTHIRGRIAVGALDAQEANAIWLAMQQKERELIAEKKDILENLLDEVQHISEDIVAGERPDHALNHHLRSVSIPATADGALVECIRDGAPKIVVSGVDDPFRQVLQHLTRPGPHTVAFACVPVRGEDEKPVGAIVIDNAFLGVQHEMDERQLDSVGAFAHIAGITILNARFSRLKQWRIFLQQAGHIIGTRIAVINALMQKYRDLIPAAQFADLAGGIAQMERVLDDFRRFATWTEGSKQRFELRRLLRDVVASVKFSMGCPIELTITPEPLEILGDSRMLAIAFLELMENANAAMCKESGRGRLIRVGARHRRSEGGSEQAIIEFADTGPGIPEGLKMRIFDPLFTTKKDKGSGLGLKMVWDAVEQHEGSIVENGVAGEGARFVITLPLAE